MLHDGFRRAYKDRTEIKNPSFTLWCVWGQGFRDLERVSSMMEIDRIGKKLLGQRRQCTTPSKLHIAHPSGLFSSLHSSAKEEDSDTRIPETEKRAHDWQLVPAIGPGLLGALDLH